MDRFEDIKAKIMPVLLPYGVKRVSLFGPVVRGEDTPESDIDILVEMKPSGERPAVGLKWYGLGDELSRILQRPVDLITESELSPYIRPYVEKGRVVLYEDSQYIR
ncbi:MAG: nucleotidyltransferase family protein [Armatimonadetes bacterium]|nr:nucleotidyltransferase family protein [Armatimonadota bacterium]